MSWVFFFAVDLLLLSFFLMGFLLSSRFFLLLFLGFFFIYFLFFWVLSFFGFFLLFLGSLFEIKYKKLKIHVFLNSTIKNSRPMWHIRVQLSK